MPSLSAYASVLCTIATLSKAQHPHFRQWNHYRPPAADPISSVASSSAVSTAPTSTQSVAVVELAADPASAVATSSASGSTSDPAASSAVSGTGTSSADSSASTSSITPNKNKAGISGFPGIQITNKAALDTFSQYISYYTDYWPNTTDFVNGDYTVIGVGMLWGNGDLNTSDPTAPLGDAVQQDTDRYNAFEALPTSPAPAYMMGFYEPDWPAPYSSNMNPATAAASWKTTLGAMSKDTLIGSPSMATQFNEEWLTPFMQELGVTEVPWDYTCIHTNKNTSQGVMDDVGYYWWKYGKPIWVSEFSCIDDETWVGCDQETVYSFIPEVVDFFNTNDSVVAYGYSNGAGLGDVWPLINSVTGDLTPSGNCYLDVLQGKVAAGASCTA